VSIRNSPTRAAFNHSAEFADVLEQLESEFYKQALAKFKDNDFAAAGFSSSQVATEQLSIIQCDEATHSTVLQVRNLDPLFIVPIELLLPPNLGCSEIIWRATHHKLQVQV